MLLTYYIFRCETRPGPQFLLRFYSFTEDGYYNLVQHHYWDESCTSPKFTINAQGGIRLGPESIITQGATTADYRANKISVTPHDAKAAKELDTTMESECPGKNFFSILKMMSNSSFSYL